MAENAYEQDQSRWGQLSGSGVDRAYISKPGDTLEDLASFFYGDPAQRQRIIDDNSDWATLKPGAALPGGSRLKMSEDAARGDSVAGS